MDTRTYGVAINCANPRYSLQMLSVSRPARLENKIVSLNFSKSLEGESTMKLVTLTLLIVLASLSSACTPPDIIWNRFFPVLGMLILNRD